MELADNLMDMIDDFKTDVDIKEQQLEQLLDHNKEMVEIAEVLGHAAVSKKEDMAGLRQKLEAELSRISSIFYSVFVKYLSTTRLFLSNSNNLKFVTALAEGKL